MSAENVALVQAVTGLEQDAALALLLSANNDVEVRPSSSLHIALASLFLSNYQFLFAILVLFCLQTPHNSQRGRKDHLLCVLALGLTSAVFPYFLSFLI